jgi:hypothetical protein|tara:strand:- start:2633 stop:2809 length:177 start_codon:yes stop_codon:yes gene_type:complete
MGMDLELTGKALKTFIFQLFGQARQVHNISLRFEYKSIGMMRQTANNFTGFPWEVPVA